MVVKIVLDVKRYFRVCCPYSRIIMCGTHARCIVCGRCIRGNPAGKLASHLDFYNWNHFAHWARPWVDRTCTQSDCVCVRARCVSTPVRVVKTSVKKKKKNEKKDHCHSGGWGGDTREGSERNPDENSLTVVILAAMTLYFYNIIISIRVRNTHAMEDHNNIIITS